MSQFEKAIFFDNDHTRLEQVASICRDITLVEVPETQPLHPTSILNMEVENPFMEYFWRLESGGNAYVQTLYELGFTDELFDPVSGIEVPHIEQLNAWLEETHDIPHRAALFDWDRTITKMEGYVDACLQHTLLESRSVEYERMIEDALIYLCGGEGRLSMLRAMFRNLHERGVELFVLTNNTGCGSVNFTNLMKKLFEDLPVRSICGKYYDFHKGEALRAHRRFATLCGARGGRRRNRRRATRKQRRQRRCTKGCFY